MKKLIPVFLVILGIGAGVGSGLAMRPDKDTQAVDASRNCAPGDGSDVVLQDVFDRDDDLYKSEESRKKLEYIKLSNQFTVPILNDDSVEAMIVMSLSLELKSGQSETVYLREPKLRDVLLQVMFDHANMGGFRGTYTDSGKLETLRRGFLDVAQGVLGEVVTEVLITDIVRQRV